MKLHSHDDPLRLERVHLGLEPKKDLSREDLEHLQTLEQDDRRTLEAHPPEAVAAEVQRRLRLEQVRARHRRRLRLSSWVALPAMAAAALLFVGPKAQVDVDLDGTETVRLKGATLAVYRKLGSGSELMLPGAPASEGDVLQLTWRLDRPAYVSVLSIDGAGAVSRHEPEEGSPLARMEAGPGRLSYAYELDDAPRFERFFLVYADTPFSVKEVMRAASTLAKTSSPERKPLHLPPGAFVLDHLVPKEASQ